MKNRFNPPGDPPDNNDDDSYSDGYDDGPYDEGYKDGYDDGYHEGINAECVFIAFLDKNGNQRIQGPMFLQIVPRQGDIIDGESINEDKGEPYEVVFAHHFGLPDHQRVTLFVRLKDRLPTKPANEVPEILKRIATLEKLLTGFIEGHRTERRQTRTKSPKSKMPGFFPPEVITKSFKEVAPEIWAWRQAQKRALKDRKEAKQQRIRDREQERIRDAKRKASLN